MKKIVALLLAMLCVMGFACADEALTITGADATLQLTVPTDLKIYAGSPFADEVSIMLIHDVMSGFSGSTTIQFYDGAADAYLNSKASSWASLHANEENFIDEVVTAEINGMQVSYICAGYKTVNNMNREVVNGTVYAAVNTGDAACATIEIDCVSQAKYGDNPVNAAFLEAFMANVTIG